MTAKLIKNLIGVDPGYIQPLKLNEMTLIADVEVTPLDANHCPGAVMFLFHRPSTGFTVLHCGDFRADAGVCANALLRARPLDVVYLDTTYCRKSYTFPDQPVALDIIAKVVRDEKQRESKTLFLVGSYSIGKEKVLSTVAAAVGSRCLVSSRRARIIKLSNCWDDAVYTTTDGDDVTVRAVPLGNFANMHQRLLAEITNSNGRFAAACALRPTGWAHTKKREREGPRPWCENGARTRIYEVPYSEHSSFTELRAFVKAVRPRALVPTVNAAERQQRAEMAELFADSMDHSRNRGRMDAYLRVGPRADPLCAERARPPGGGTDACQGPGGGPGTTPAPCAALAWACDATLNPDCDAPPAPDRDVPSGSDCTSPSRYRNTAGLSLRRSESPPHRQSGHASPGREAEPIVIEDTASDAGGAPAEACGGARDPPDEGGPACGGRAPRGRSVAGERCGAVEGGAAADGAFCLDDVDREEQGRLWEAIKRSASGGGAKAKRQCTIDRFVRVGPGAVKVEEGGA